MKYFRLLIVSVFGAFVLSGCGGDESTGNSSTGISIATFVDSYVSGLEFESATQSGITDSNGNFTYQEGETVTFHIGNLYLGTAKPVNGKVTPLDIVGTKNISDDKVVRILRTLQTLDNDGDPSNGITIDIAVRETLKMQKRVDMQSATDADVLDVIGKNDFSVTSSQAQRSFTPNAISNQSKGYVPYEPETFISDIGTPGYTLIAWNDLGMHCMDGKDYSVFSILPPYNNIHAHLIDKNATAGKNITSGVTLTYEAVADTTGSINTASATKTNFWNWVLAIFGKKPAEDHGLNLSDPHVSNPALSKNSAPMSYNSLLGWWEAEGIPVTPYDDKMAKNYYPMAKIVAKDSSGNVLATTKIVLPVSDEMSCKRCHASNSVNAAKPTGGWVNNQVNLEKDWKQNILRLHDEKFPSAISDAGMQSSYTGGSLEATANGGQPILCAACHKSNALMTPAKAGIKPLTEALHAKHASVIDPDTGLSMNSSTNRDSCYKCHPGSSTKCLRGTMGNAKKADGSNAIDCQSCHGSMSNVGRSGREGWLDQPNCQSCHDQNGSSSANFTRFTSVFSSGSTLRSIVDSTGRFATNANTPANGFSLYRFSKGHGNLQCEACHGSTHAEYPSSHANDNVQSVAVQGHAGTIVECSSCHVSIPKGPGDFFKGPHGMHIVGQSAIGRHKKIAPGNQSSCKVCHGADYRGSILSATSQARELLTEDGPVKFAVKHQVSCYDCHNGPNP